MFKKESKKNKYTITVSGLDIGLHTYKFNLDDGFLSDFQHPDVFGGNVKAQVELNKKTDVIEAVIEIFGTLQVECDRCLDLFDLPVENSETIIYTIGKQPNYENEEVTILPKEQSEIDFSQLLYEISVTQIPISKTHPDDANGKSTCNAEMLRILEKYKIKNNSEEN